MTFKMKQNLRKRKIRKKRDLKLIPTADVILWWS